MIDLGNKKDIKEVLERLGIKEGTPPANPVPTFSIEDILNGQTFYDKNLPTAFRKALKYATPDGIVASMPCLIAGKAEADKSSYLWDNWFTALSEENVGVDKKGCFVPKGKPVVVTLHGGGILTPNSIQKAYDKGLIEQNAAKYTGPEFDDLLDGILPNGETIKLYTLEDIKKGIPQPFGGYAVVTDFETAKATQSGYLTKKEFIENPLVIARVGTLEYLEKYFEKAKRSSDHVRNSHPFNDIDINQPQGRLLFLGYGGCCGSLGRYGYSLDGRGWFAVVSAGGALKTFPKKCI